MKSGRLLSAVALGVLLFVLSVMALLMDLAPAPAPPAGPESFGHALWSVRPLDILVQGFLLLAGVLAILLVLQHESQEARRG